MQKPSNAMNTNTSKRERERIFTEAYNEIDWMIQFFQKTNEVFFQFHRIERIFDFDFFL